MRLKDRVALVTGAGRGIGQAIALAFAREGARVAVTDIDPTTAQATARRIGRAKALALQMDVADAGSVRDGFDAIHRAWGRIDVAVTSRSSRFSSSPRRRGTASSTSISRARSWSPRP